MSPAPEQVNSLEAPLLSVPLFAASRADLHVLTVARRSLSGHVIAARQRFPPMCHLSFHSELISQRCAALLRFALTQMKTCRRCTDKQQHTSDSWEIRLLPLILAAERPEMVFSVHLGDDCTISPLLRSFNRGFQTGPVTEYYHILC